MNVSVLRDKSECIRARGGDELETKAQNRNDIFWMRVRVFFSVGEY